MLLQKLRHSVEDMGEDCILTHVVNEVCNGGEYTVCGRAIPDARFIDDGWEQVGDEFRGSFVRCDCKDCRKIITYFKSLR